MTTSINDEGYDDNRRSATGNDTLMTESDFGDHGKVAKAEKSGN